MRVVITLASLDFGGPELRYLRIIRAMRARRIPADVTVFVSGGRRGTLDDAYRGAGASVIHGRRGLPGVVDLWRLCRRVKPDVLHINAATLAGVYGLGGLLAGVGRRIAQFNTILSAPEGWVGRLQRRAERLALRCFCNRAVGICDAARIGTGVRSSRWLTIYNGIVLPPDLPPPEGRGTGVLDVLMLGRIDRLKNTRRGIRIIAAVRDAGVPVALHLVGRGGGEDQLAAVRAEIERLDLGGMVHFHGEVLPPLDHLRAADVLLMPSMREGLPTAILEALSCGLPVVATGLGGIAEIATRTTGLTLLSLADDDSTWAEALVSAARADRPAIRAAFARSPFQFERLLADILALWAGPAQAGASSGPSGVASRQD